VIIAVPDAPGHPLPAAAREADRIARLIPGALVLPRPTHDAVLDALPRFSIAHFACATDEDNTNPAASKLLLPDHETTPLTVADISQLRIPGGLVYLSCDATSPTHPSLANEAGPIAGAFSTAGYQQVISTIWPVTDIAAARMATWFYQHLTQDGTTPPDLSLAAHSMHQAVQQLRARYPAAPTEWASYIHTGS
jgi:CHAT domain-containing protein